MLPVAVAAAEAVGDLTAEAVLPEDRLAPIKSLTLLRALPEIAAPLRRLEQEGRVVQVRTHRVEALVVAPVAPVVALGRQAFQVHQPVVIVPVKILEPEVVAAEQVHT
jgi:hypothetical protein